jgi:hypothetical protein
MMQTVGMRDMSVQEVCHQILKIKLHSSSFEVITASLDGSRKVQIVGDELVNHLSLLDIYASRNYLHSESNVQGLNFIDFHSNYIYQKGKIMKRKKIVIVRTIPKFSSYAQDVNYGKYCKFQLIKFKVWVGSVSSAWSNLDECDDNFIREWSRFLQSEFARNSVPSRELELQNVQNVLSNNDDSEIEDSFIL